MGFGDTSESPTGGENSTRLELSLLCGTLVRVLGGNFPAVPEHLCASVSPGHEITVLDGSGPGVVCPHHQTPASAARRQTRGSSALSNCFPPLCLTGGGP